MILLFFCFHFFQYYVLVTTDLTLCVIVWVITQLFTTLVVVRICLTQRLVESFTVPNIGNYLY